MIKLIKKDSKLQYWEVWEDGKTLIVHFGTVGDTGETEEINLSLIQKAKKVMEKLAKEKVNNGFEFLDEDKLIQLVVQYSYEEGEMEATLNKRHFVEDLMNECLGWTGNGSCDGGDIGSGTANIINYVINVDEALRAIIEVLTNNNLLENVKIAYLNEDEEFISLYPEGASFDIMQLSSYEN
ncbi:WGR domain-containing protein [Paenibacillus sp. KQZ6P-2]|uniref:WGR domain-containing protein n=1 Tax=Paenibacillus mangrovi TaxID=2931978 RepID=A0A9X2B5N9_9BACL|nr:WGR domain-containing protein [Paenibacillus mangrovi]MCJ8015210.1 WGR domain-containing protein [Paenibacillus mangrovi]